MNGNGNRQDIYTYIEEEGVHQAECRRRRRSSSSSNLQISIPTPLNRFESYRNFNSDTEIRRSGVFKTRIPSACKINLLLVPVDSAALKSDAIESSENPKNRKPNPAFGKPICDLETPGPHTYVSQWVFSRSFSDCFSELPARHLAVENPPPQRMQRVLLNREL